MLRRLGVFFLDILQIVVFAVAIFLFVYLLILQPHKIKGSSMEPNFENGEFLLTDKVTYRFGEPQRGEVIVFKAPPDEKDEFIKRIIALPGDKISLRDGNIYISGIRLYEEYLETNVVTLPGNFLGERQEILIPPYEYFVMGDNRLHSSDSRTWGLVKKEKITGRAWLVYWPPTKSGLVKSVLYTRQF